MFNRTGVAGLCASSTEGSVHIHKREFFDFLSFFFARGVMKN